MSGLWKRLRALAVPPEESPGHRRALRLAGLAIVVVFAAFAAGEVDLRRLGASLAAASPGLLLLGAIANVVNLVFHAFRWAAVVRPKGVRVRAVDVFHAMNAGFAVGIAVPARAGDLVRSHLLARRAGLRRSFVIASAAVDYVVGTAALAPLVAFMLTRDARLLGLLALDVLALVVLFPSAGRWHELLPDPDGAPRAGGR